MNKHLPFIYSPEKSIEVLHTTEAFFEKNPDIQKRIEELGWIYQDIGKTIPQTMENVWSGHFFPYMESWDELQISFNLVMLGLYKQAFVSLRSALEVGMLSVYYNINDDGHNTVQTWIKSKNSWEGDTPRADKIWKILKSNSNIATFDEKFKLHQKFDELSYLHNYVHTKGAKFSNRLGGHVKSNWQTFEERILYKWIDAYEQVIVLVLTLHLLKYPIGIIEFEWSKKCGIDNPYPVLEISEIEKIKKVLPKDHVDEIKRISENDSATQTLLNHILELPDITEEEQDQQIIKLDQMMIEHGNGFIAWEKREIELMKHYSHEGKIKALKRIEILREWACKNNMMKSKMERLREQGFFDKDNK
jgi:hypothetical protein